MRILAAGHPYNPDRTTWPSTTLHWILTEGTWSHGDGGVEVAMFLDDPSAAERSAFQHGWARFALITGHHALVLALKLGTMPWWDAPWQATRQTVAQPGLTNITDDQHLPLMMVMVNSRTGMVEQIRGISWPGPFNKAMQRAIAHQLANSSDDDSGRTEIETWYRDYRTPQDLVLRRAEHIVVGGLGT